MDGFGAGGLNTVVVGSDAGGASSHQQHEGKTTLGQLDWQTPGEADAGDGRHHHQTSVDCYPVMIAAKA